MRRDSCRLHPRQTRPLSHPYFKVLLAAGCLFGGTLSAQEDQQDSRLFFDAVDVRVVNIEAVVTDKNGDPVSGLTADNFTIVDDGEELDITNFFVVEGSQIVGSDDLELGLDAVPAQAASGPETRNLNLVMLVDNLHTDPRNRNQIFSELRRFLGNLDPEDRILIVNLGDRLTIETSFTNNLDEITEVLSRRQRQARHE